MFRATFIAVCVLFFAAFCFGASIGVDGNDNAHSGENNAFPGKDNNNNGTGKHFLNLFSVP